MAKNKSNQPMEQKKPKWYDEDWVSEHPDPKKISCGDCAFRAEDRDFGDSVMPGSTLAMCDVYDSKPNDILFKGVKCPYYVSEEDMNEK